jgi:hypothetical protein
MAETHILDDPKQAQKLCALAYHPPQTRPAGRRVKTEGACLGAALGHADLGWKPRLIHAMT